MKVSDQIIQVLDALCEKFGLVVDWTGANVVPYLTELCSRVCAYEIATSIFWMILAVIMIIGGIVYYRYIWKNPVDFDTFDVTIEQVNAVLSIVILVAFGLIGTIMLCTQTLDIIQAICIPELTIIEKVKDLTASIPKS